VTLPGSPGAGRPATPSGPPFTRSTSAARTRVTTDPIRSFFFLRGVPRDRRARAPRAAGPGTKAAGTPAFLPSGYLLAALALLVLAHPAILGWILGAGVVRGGWVSRGRLAAAASVTGAPALLWLCGRFGAGAAEPGSPGQVRFIGRGQ
jgi:hypothetical protein